MKYIPIIIAVETLIESCLIWYVSPDLNELIVLDFRKTVSRPKSLAWNMLCDIVVNIYEIFTAQKEIVIRNIRNVQM